MRFDEAARDRFAVNLRSAVRSGASPRRPWRRCAIWIARRSACSSARNARRCWTRSSPSRAPWSSTHPPSCSTESAEADPAGARSPRRRLPLASSGASFQLHAAGPRVVRVGLRRAHPGAGAGLAGDRAGRARAAVGADRVGQDAGGVSVGARPAERRAPRAAGPPVIGVACGAAHRPAAARRVSAAAADGSRLTRVVYVSPLKALAYDIERNLRAPLHGIAAPSQRRARRHPHRRHAPARARGDAAQPAGHPDHDARVALPDAHLARAGDAQRGRGGDRRRDPRGRRHQARLAPGAHARAARGPGPLPGAPRPDVSSGSGLGPRPRIRWRRSAATSSARTARSRSSTRARVRSSTCGSRSRSSRCPNRMPDRRRRLGSPNAILWSPSPAGSPRADRSGRRSTPSCCGSCEEHNSTIVFVNNRRSAERVALRLNELAARGSRGTDARSPVPITARSRARSARRSRSC